MLLRFFRSEPASAIVLFVAAVTAMVMANTPANHAYHAVLDFSILSLSIHHWINDGLMAIFFLQVGLEIKHELLHGELASWQARIIPGVAALGGMIMPALLYAAVNMRNPETLRGWAIPSATDIAFALGVLTLLGPRVPSSLRALLVGIAIMDDLGAILVIALFYSSDLAPVWILGCAVIFAGLIAMNRFGVARVSLYLVVGIGLWIGVLQSGLHATLAGVLVALVIPASTSQRGSVSPALALEKRLDPWVSFMIIPLFGLSNAGVTLSGLSRADIVGTVPLGIALGLLVGKQVGVFGAIWLAVRCKIGILPAGTSWMHIYGVSLVCGIGFTMSLFIGDLAFARSDHLMEATRVGVLMGSICSAVLGTLILRRALHRKLDVGSLPVARDPER